MLHRTVASLKIGIKKQSSEKAKNSFVVVCLDAFLTYIKNLQMHL